LLPTFQASATGAYMAGQQALQELRTDEAARYFYQAAQADWQNSILVERAFIAFAADGQIGQAAATAKHLLELDPSNELAELVVATQALKERRYDAAESQLGTIGQDSFTGITASILRAWALVGANRKADADAMLDTLGETGLDDFLVFHRALMAEVAGQTDLTIDLAGQAYDAEPYVARVVELDARVLANAGRADEARDVIAEFENQGLSHPMITLVRSHSPGAGSPYAGDSRTSVEPRRRQSWQCARGAGRPAVQHAVPPGDRPLHHREPPPGPGGDPGVVGRRGGGVVHPARPPGPGDAFDPREAGAGRHRAAAADGHLEPSVRLPVRAAAADLRRPLNA
jgi:hypothetical protein